MNNKFKLFASALFFIGLISLFQNCGKFDVDSCKDCESLSSMENGSVEGESTVVDPEILPRDLDRDPILDYQKRNSALDVFVEDTEPQKVVGMENYNSDASFSFNAPILGLLSDQHMMGGFGEDDVIDFYYRAEQASSAELVHSVKLSQLISTDERDERRIKFVNLDVVSSDKSSPLLRISSRGIAIHAQKIQMLHAGEYWLVVRVGKKSIRFPNWTLAVESADCSPGTYYTAKVPTELSAFEGFFVSRTAGGDYGLMSKRDHIERVYPGLFTDFYDVSFDTQGIDGFGQGRVGTIVQKDICSKYIPFVTTQRERGFRLVGGEVSFECRAQKWRVIKNTCEFQEI